MTLTPDCDSVGEVPQPHIEAATVFEIDFLQTSGSSKSSDAITVRLTIPGRLAPAVIVVDAGYAEAAEMIAEHVTSWYGTNRVDVVVSTHPDANHLNGIPALFDLLTVGELLIHDPRRHGHAGTDADCEAIHDVVSAARAAGVPVEEPLAGLQRLGGAMTVVGPSSEYYQELLSQQIGPVALLKSASHLLAEVTSRTLEKKWAVLPWAPAETLVDDHGGTTERNNSSAILSLTADGRRALLTGDAGVPALERACDYMDDTGISLLDLHLFQIPHHGSRRNVHNALLDRLLGTSGVDGTGRYGAGVASAAALDPKHPHPSVTNAVKRRGFSVYTNARGHLNCPLSGPRRPWAPATEEPWYEEDDGASSAAA